MLETFFLMLRIVVTGLVLYAVAQLFQGNHVAPWLAWWTSIIVVSQLAMASAKPKKD